MTIPRAQTLINDYARNTWLIHDHVDGIIDQESLLQLPILRMTGIESMITSRVEKVKPAYQN